MANGGGLGSIFRLANCCVELHLSTQYIENFLQTISVKAIKAFGRFCYTDIILREVAGTNRCTCMSRSSVCCLSSQKNRTITYIHVLWNQFTCSHGS